MTKLAQESPGIATKLFLKKGLEPKLFVVVQTCKETCKKFKNGENRTQALPGAGYVGEIHNDFRHINSFRSSGSFSVSSSSLSPALAKKGTVVVEEEDR